MRSAERHRFRSRAHRTADVDLFLVGRVEKLVEDGCDESHIAAVLDELGFQFVDDVPEDLAVYFISRCIALTEESAE